MMIIHKKGKEKAMQKPSAQAATRPFGSQSFP